MPATKIVYLSTGMRRGFRSEVIPCQQAKRSSGVQRGGARKRQPLAEVAGGGASQHSRLSDRSPKGKLSEGGKRRRSRSGKNKDHFSVGKMVDSFTPLPNFSNRIKTLSFLALIGGEFPINWSNFTVEGFLCLKSQNRRGDHDLQCARF